MRNVEAWGTAISSVLLLLVASISAILAVSMLSNHPLASAVAGVICIVALLALWSSLPSFDRFSWIWSLLPATMLIDFALLMIYQGIAHDKRQYVGFGLVALVSSGWALKPVAVRLRAHSLPKTLRWLRPRVPLEKALERLADCGIHLRPQYSADSLREADRFGFLDGRSYDGVVSIMGGYGKSLDEEAFSDDVWYDDIECIFEPMDYVRVANHLRRLSKGDFAIEDVRVELDADGAEITLSFTLNGKEHELWAPYGDDMMDVEIWAELQSLFESSCEEDRRLEHVVYGQDGCYLYITPEQKACLKELGLVFFT